jgi:hypothetical protein
MNWVCHHLNRLALALYILSLVLFSNGCTPEVYAPTPTPPSFSSVNPELQAIGTAGEKFFPELEADYVVFENGSIFYALTVVPAKLIIQVITLPE